MSKLGLNQNSMLPFCWTGARPAGMISADGGPDEASRLSAKPPGALASGTVDPLSRSTGLTAGTLSGLEAEVTWTEDAVSVPPLARYIPRAWSQVTAWA